MVPPDSDRVPPAPPYSGAGSGSNALCRRGCHPLRPAFPGVFRYHVAVRVDRPTTPRAPRRPRFGLFPFRSPLLGESLLVFLSSAYLDVSVRRVRLPLSGMARLQRAGFPHSDIRGSRAVRASPRLFAACRVLRRLREPRHPPCALRYLSRTGACPAAFAARELMSILALLSFQSRAKSELFTPNCDCLSFHHVKDHRRPGAPKWRTRESNP